MIFVRRSGSNRVVVPDDFLNDEIQQLLGEIGIEMGLHRKPAQPRDHGASKITR